jgi:hypothetical protein
MTPEERAELVRLKELLRGKQEPVVQEPVKPKRGRKAKG